MQRDAVLRQLATGQSTDPKDHYIDIQAILPWREAAISWLVRSRTRCSSSSLSRDLRFGLLEPGSFDDVPTAVSLCYGKLVCAYHIQDFHSSARRQRVAVLQAVHRLTRGEAVLIPRPLSKAIISSNIRAVAAQPRRTD